MAVRARLIGATMAAVDSTRVDRWLWAVRVLPTRSASTAACHAGHVRVNGAPAKASTAVRPGDRVEARVGQRARVVEVVTVIEKRVGAPLAAACLVDHSPPPPAKAPPTFVRERGAGRPTKRDRRDLDRLRQAPR